MSGFHRDRATRGFDDAIVSNNPLHSWNLGPLSVRSEERRPHFMDALASYYLALYFRFKTRERLAEHGTCQVATGVSRGKPPRRDRLFGSSRRCNSGSGDEAENGREGAPKELAASPVCALLRRQHTVVRVSRCGAQALDQVIGRLLDGPDPADGNRLCDCG